MPRPLIGLTVHPDDDPDRVNLDQLLAQIIQGVERAGGLPTLVPLGLADETLRDLSARLDGLLLTGGGDVDPARYGAEPHPSLGGVSAERDRTEHALVLWATRTAPRPLFGICRGAQVLNVAWGGSLYRDIASELSGAIQHNYLAETHARQRPHAIQVAEDSLLARLLEQPLLNVNSLHHQGLRAVAPGLRVTARAADGLAEAVEVPGHAFALAVQWHPECLPEAPEQRRLFEAFVEAAGRHAAQRAAG